MSEHKKEPTSLSTVGEGLTIAAFTALLLPAGLVLLVWFTWGFSSIPFNLLPGLAGLALATLPFIAGEIPGADRWRTVLRRLARAVAALSLAVLAATLGWNAYQKSITISNYPEDSLDTSLYQPFQKDSRIAQLEGEASLRFSPSDDLPVVDGATALFPVYSAMVNATYPSNSPVLRSWHSHSAYYGTIWDLGAGAVDIFFSAALGEGWEPVYYPEGSDDPVRFEFIPVGGQGLVFFTSTANPVEGLTQDQLRGIYAGTITNWAQVGGEDIPILPYQRHHNSDIQAALQRFMGEVPLAPPLTEVRRYLDGSGGEYLANYRNAPGAIGFTFSAYAPQLQEKYHIKLLAVDGVTPSQETIGQGSYPITDAFYMVVRKGDRSEETDRFIAWALSEEGQALVAGSGYAPVAKIEP